MQQKQKSTAAPPGAPAAGSAHRRAPSIALVNTNADNAAVTELSIGRLTTRPDDVTLSIDWEKRTTSVTLVYNQSPSRVPQGVAAAERRNTTTVVQIPCRPSSLVDPAAPPTRAGSPCSRGCREGGAARGPRNPIPVPQLGLPTSPVLASAIGQALSGEGDTIPSASPNTPRIPLPRRNVVQANRAAARARAEAPSPEVEPQSEPQPANERAPPPASRPSATAPGVAAVETTATPATPARPARGEQVSARGPARSAAASTAARKTAAAASTKTTSPTSHTVRVKAEIVTHGDPNDSSSTPTKRSITLYPHKQSRKIRGTSSCTTWYGPTESLNRLPAPPHILRPRRGYVYVHKHRAGVQMWMYVCPPQPAAAAVSAAGVGASAAAGAEGGARGRTRTRQRDVDADGDVRMPDAREQAAEEVGEEEVGWRMVYPGHAHPDMEGYVLHLLDDGTPRWVKESSAKTYECGRKLRRRLERYSEC